MQSSRPRNTTHCIPVGREPTGSPPPLMDEDEFRWDYDEGEETEVIRELNYAQLDLWSPQFLSRRQNAREQQTVLTYRQIAGDYWTRGIDQADIMRANETDVNIDGRPIPSNRSDRLCVSSTLATSYGIPGMRRRVEWEDHSNTADTSEKVWDAVINGSTLRKLMPKPCKKFGRAEQMENLIRARQQGCGPLGSTETDMKDALSWTWYGYFQSDDRSLQMSLVQNPDPAQYLEDSQRELQTNWNLFGGPHTQYILMNRMRCSTTEFTPIWPTMYRYGPIIEQAAPQPQDKCSYGFHYGCACYGRWIDVTRYYAIVRKEEHIWDWVLSNCGWEPMMPIIVCDMHRDHGLYGKGSGIIGRALRFPTDDGHTWYHDLKADQLTASEALMLDALYCYCLQAVQYRTLLTMISEPVSESARLKPSESYWDAVIDAYGDEGERIFRLHYAEMERITWSAPPEMVDNASKERLPINAEFMEGSTLGAKLRTLKKTNLLTVLSTPIEEPHDVEQADVPDSRLQEVLDQQSVDYHNRSQRSGVGHPEREPLLWRDNLNHRNILSWGAVTKALDALSTIIIFFFLVIFTGYVLCNIPGANAETISGIPTGTPVPEFNFTVPLALAPPKVELEEEIPLTLGEWWSSRPEGYFWNLTQPYVEMIMGPVQKWFDNSVLTPKMLSMVVLPILCAFIPRPQIAVMLWAMLGYLVRNDMVEMARFLVSFSFFLFFERLRNPSRFWVTITYSICLHILEASYTMPLKQAFVAITVSLTITLACILFASVTRLVKENALLLIDRSYPIFTWGVFLFGMLTSWYGILVIALVAVISALFVVVRGSNKFVQQIDHVVGTNRPVYGAIRRVYPTILGAPWVDKVIFGVDTESAQGVRFVPGDVIHGVVSEGANRPWSWWNWFLFILGYEPKFYLPEDSSSSQLAVHSATETEAPEQRLKADSVQSTPVIGTMDPVLVTKPGPSRKNSIPSSSTSSPLPDYPYMTEKELRGVLAKFLAPHVAVGDISPADAMKMGNTVFRIIMALDKQENEGARSHPVDLITAAFESWDGKNRKQSHRMRRLNQKEVEDWAQDFIDDQDVAAWEDDYSFNNDYNDPGDGNIKIGRRKARKMRAPPVHEHAPRVIRESAFDNNVLMKSAGYEKYRIYEKAPNWIGVPENVSEENIEEFAAEFGSEWIGRRPPFDSCWVHGEGAIMGELITTLQAEAAMKKSEFFPGDPGVVVEIVTEKGDLMGTGFVYCGCIHTIRHVIDVPDTPQFMRAHFADKSFKIYPLGKAIGYVPYVSPSWANVAHVKEGDWIFRAPQQWFHDLTLLKTPLHTTRLIPFPSGAPLGQVRARIDQYPQNLPGPLFGPTSSPGDAWFDGRHTCSTNGASSGGPLRLFEGTKVTDKVIGVHCGAAGPSLNFFIPFDEKTIQAIDAVCKGQTKIPEPGRVDLPESADPLAEWEARLVQAAWVEGVMPDIGQMTTEQVARFLKTMEKFPFVHPKKPDQKLPEQAKPTQLPTASTETQAPPQPKTKKEKGKQVKTPAQSEESIRAEFAKLQKAHAKLKRRLEKKSPKSGNGGGPSSSGPHQPQQPPQQGAGATTNHH